MKKFILSSFFTFLISLFLAVICDIAFSFYSLKYQGQLGIGDNRDTTTLIAVVVAFTFYLQYAVFIYGAFRIYKIAKLESIRAPQYLFIIGIFLLAPYITFALISSEAGMINTARITQQINKKHDMEQNNLCPSDGVRTKSSASGVSDTYTCKNGRLNGIYKKYDSSGVIETTQEYIDGYRNGLYRKYNEDGLLNSQMRYFLIEEKRPFGATAFVEDASGRYGYKDTYIQLSDEEDFIKNGVDSKLQVCTNKDGINRQYFNDFNGQTPSTISRSYTCKNGILSGVYTEYIYLGNGKVKSEISYVNGMRSGDFKFYWSEGPVRLNGTYLNDKKDGVFRQYNLDGSLVYEVIYKNDVLQQSAQ